MVVIAIRICNPHNNDKNGNKLNIIHCPMPILQTILGVKDSATKVEGWDGL